MNTTHTTQQRARREPTERFSLCLTPGSKRTLLALLGAGPAGLVSVRRAAVRSSLEDRYALDAAGQMYRTARQEAPVAIIYAHPPDEAPESFLRHLRRRLGPFADISAIPAEAFKPGTWGMGVAGAACGLGYQLDRVPDAVLLLARTCEIRATGTE